jgi:hypothetical protein
MVCISKHGVSHLISGVPCGWLVFLFGAIKINGGKNEMGSILFMVLFPIAYKVIGII